MIIKGIVVNLRVAWVSMLSNASIRCQFLSVWIVVTQLLHSFQEGCLARCTIRWSDLNEGTLIYLVSFVLLLQVVNSGWQHVMRVVKEFSTSFIGCFVIIATGRHLVVKQQVRIALLKVDHWRVGEQLRLRSCLLFQVNTPAFSNSD